MGTGWDNKPVVTEACIAATAESMWDQQSTELELKEPWQPSFEELSSTRGADCVASTITASLGFQTTDFSLTRMCGI